MDAFWTLEGLRASLGGTIAARGSGAGGAGGVSIDTRTLERGQVFAAMRGEHTDGHRFLAQAAAAGAPLALVDREVRDIPAGLGVLRVEDVGEALVTLARLWRRRLSGTRVIGITGSNGKTTTTRLVDAVLATRLRGRRSIKSFNNRLGVPLTILGAAPADQYLVCEIGMNAPGEIAELTAIADPDIGVITSIGRAHLEGVGSIEGVAREKSALLSRMRPAGIRLAPAGVAALEPFLRPLENVIRVGADQGDVRVSGVRTGPEGVRFSITGFEGEMGVPLLGAHNAHNAAIAAVVGRRLGLGDAEIRAGLASAQNEAMRLQLERIAGVLLVNDAYNANPESMRAGLRVLAEVAGGRRRVAVLGEMRELGPQRDALHEELGSFLTEHRLADALVAVGPGAGGLLRGAGVPSVHVPELDGPGMARVLDAIGPGDAVLLKGSRAVGLERVARALRAREEAPAR